MAAVPNLVLYVFLDNSPPTPQAKTVKKMKMKKISSSFEYFNDIGTCKSMVLYTVYSGYLHLHDSSHLHEEGPLQPTSHLHSSSGENIIL